MLLLSPAHAAIMRGVMTHIGLNAHLLSSRDGYRSAGIHGYIYHTLQQLPHVAPDGWRFSAFVGAGNPHTFDGVTMRPARLDTSAASRRVLWEQVLQPAQLNRFDLYHALAFVAPVLPYRPPTVVTVYDLSFIHYPHVLSSSRRAYLRTFTRRTCEQAAQVVAISQSTADDLTAAFGIPPEKITVAYAATDFTRFRPLPADEVAAFRAEKGLPERFWLFIGTLEPRKNLPTLLQAYATLPKSARPPLILAGGKGWDYAPIFAAINQLQLTDDVRLPGFIPTDELPLWYNSAEVFVYPSLYEGFGMPPLEAMACGTPVIVSDASSLPEVIAGTDNLRVPPHDLDGWIAALRTALDDATWRERATHSGYTQANVFTWEASARQTLQAYRKVLER